jgi:hypothetical protein
VISPCTVRLPWMTALPPTLRFALIPTPPVTTNEPVVLEVVALAFASVAEG